jgi:ABC-2 type transport system permease protein
MSQGVHIDRIVRTYRQLAGLFFRDFAQTRRHWSWVCVFTVNAVVMSVTIGLIGVAEKDTRLTLTLAIGALLWSFLSVLFSEIAMSVAIERWEGTLEDTLIAPLSRFTHMLGVCLHATVYATVRATAVLGGLMCFLNVDLRGANLAGVTVVLVASSFAFSGLAIVAATLPLLSPERGAEATNIFQSVLLLVSGVYFPVSVLPFWLQPLASVSPATYALNATRKLIGITNYSGHGRLEGEALSTVVPEILVLFVMGAVLVPLGLFTFAVVERWAKCTGRLKRSG